MATATKTLYTAEEFMALDLGDGIFELVQGEVVEMPVPMPEHGRVSFKSGFVLEVYGTQTGRGYVIGNDSAVVTERGPDTIRGADVAYYSSARWPREKLGPRLIPIAPDLVVEVSSPSNRPGEMLKKVNEYLRAGVGMVWVISPTKRTIAIYRPDDLPPIVLGESAILEDLPELPGFRCAVADFFR